MATATQAAAPPAGTVTDPIRVMVVDDSVVIRGLISRWVDADPALAVVASHRNGKLAVDDIERSNPDVVVLDIEMPEMDGLTALPLMLAKKKNLVVVMASTLTRRNAEISLKALSLGAQDYVPKPESSSSISTSVDFRRELIEKLKSLGPRARRGAGFARRPMRAETAAGQQVGNAAVAARPGAIVRPAFTLRNYSSARPRILAIGSSTGGPQALQQLFRDIGSTINDIPVVVTQHMPPTFTAILAEHLAKAALRPAAEAQDGEVLKPGQIYVAPGGKHLVLEKDAGAAKARLTDDPPVNFCKPAVDPLFDSVAKIYGSATLAIVLTGMGHDGAAGVKTIAAAGGSIIAQDEKTSVVWGMPGAAAQTGQCSEVLPLEEIGPKVIRILGGRR
ncbi:two-component system chemotaxis response regulator CheB [Breoghania corrubedonensis]|uniref:Protein-glutamate methylesterase/protein-glutamine glutaminase n=1 Tax=Breoghania corrubedonensis TaxID=665038 RepID=A0A2T5V7M4_9HYPH|nr:chemotaxis response regulator protein-glutamate methylesterase [Breoghania corrubedonensis]PTW59736.1 two-component system chemotaxis response regulator CheB [Breoghania corrubedonensis]